MRAAPTLSIPVQLLDALGHGIRATQIAAWAPLGAAPGTSMGETHVFLMHGVGKNATRALTRPRPWDPYEHLDLDPGDLPRLEEAGFETWVVFPLRNGDEARVALTAHDRTRLDPLLAALHHEPPARPHPADDTAEVPAAAPNVVSNAPERPSAAAALPLQARIDRALALIELVGQRAGVRGELSSVDVSAQIAYEDGSLGLSAHFDRATLARLAARSAPSDVNT